MCIATLLIVIHHQHDTRLKIRHELIVIIYLSISIKRESVDCLETGCWKFSFHPPNFYLSFYQWMVLNDMISYIISNESQCTVYINYNFDLFKI
jgi:hypothetical protein